MNPFVPTPVDGAAVIAAVMGLVLGIAAFISVICAGGLSGRRTAAWVLVVLALPFVGATAWFLSRRRRHATAAGRAADHPK